MNTFMQLWLFEVKKALSKPNVTSIINKCGSFLYNSYKNKSYAVFAIFPVYLFAAYQAPVFTAQVFAACSLIGATVFATTTGLLAGFAKDNISSDIVYKLNQGKWEGILLEKNIKLDIPFDESRHLRKRHFDKIPPDKVLEDLKCEHEYNFIHFGKNLALEITEHEHLKIVLKNNDGSVKDSKFPTPHILAKFSETGFDKSSLSIKIQNILQMKWLNSAVEKRLETYSGMEITYDKGGQVFVNGLDVTERIKPTLQTELIDEQIILPKAKNTDIQEFTL